MKTLLKILVPFIICSSLCYADIINVPADANSIQEGINLANPGDTVLVHPGVYFENINFKGKAITVASRFILDGKKSHIASTIINGSRPSHPDSGSVVYFINGEDTTSVLCGFTITGGSGTIREDEGGWRHGGGIFGLNSGAYIKNNHIVRNEIHHGDNAFGGGIYIHNLNNHACIIENNLVRKNTLVSYNVSLYSIGAGIYVNGSETEDVLISNNKIMDNSISAPLAYGGGILPSNFGNVNFTIVNNIISGNKVNAEFGGSGGIDVFNHFPVIRNNVIAHNSAPLGGGILMEFFPPTTGATTAGLTGPRGLGTRMLKRIQTPDIEIANLLNNTLFDNSATLSGGGMEIIGITPQLMNFIVWGNTAPNGPQISGSPDIQYSDVEGGWSGTGNLNVNPRLRSPLLLLKFKSPCVDAGNPDPVYDDPESISQPGYAQWPSMGMVRNDMGAYGGPGAACWWDFFDFAKEIETLEFEEKDAVTENQKRSVQIKQFPNPFNPTTTIKYQIPALSVVTLKVYDVLGNEIAKLVNEEKQSGTYDVEFDGTALPSGIYFYRLRVYPANGGAVSFVETKKMVLMK
jgi:hypothetical protein